VIVEVNACGVTFLFPAESGVKLSGFPARSQDEITSAER
jgi:hypothetical protein